MSKPVRNRPHASLERESESEAAESPRAVEPSSPNSNSSARNTSKVSKPSVTHASGPIATPFGISIQSRTPASPSGGAGGSSTSGSSSASTQVDREALMYNSAMSLAKSPLGKVLMTAFMLYMAGGSLSIFTLFMLGMALWQPLKAIFDTKSVFARFEGNSFSLLTPYLVWIACNGVLLAMAMWKAQSLGLLPSFSELMQPTPIVKNGLEYAAKTVQIELPNSETSILYRN